jgi:hypothetical protein
LKAAGRQDSIMPAVPTIVEFLKRTGGNTKKSSEVLKAAVGLLGDLGATFGKKLQLLFREPFASALIQEAMDDEESKPNAIWAQEVSEQLT